MGPVTALGNLRLSEEEENRKAKAHASPSPASTGAQRSTGGQQGGPGVLGALTSIFSSVLGGGGGGSSKQ